MRVAFKNNMKLSEAKTLIKTVKAESGKLSRNGSAGSATLKDHRGLSTVLIFQSNLELRNLIK